MTCDCQGDVSTHEWDYDTALYLKDIGKEDWWVISSDGNMYGFTEHYNRTTQGKFQWDHRNLSVPMQKARLLAWKSKFDQGHGHIERFLDRDEKANKVLVKWAGHPEDKASWVKVDNLVRDFDDSKESKELKDLIYHYVRTGEQGSTLLIALDKKVAPCPDLAILHTAHQDKLLDGLVSSLPKDMKVRVHCLTRGPYKASSNIPFKVILAHGPPPFPMADSLLPEYEQTGLVDLPAILERAGPATKLLVPIFCHADPKIHGPDCSKFAVKHGCSVLILEKGKTFYHEVEHFLLTLSQYWRCAMETKKESDEVDIFTFLTGSGACGFGIPCLC